MFTADFLKEVNQHSGEKVQLCFQCFKCSLGCPVSFAMDYLPHQLLRMVQMGLKDRVLHSHTIWVCAACETCTTRCPNHIDIARVIDTLRQMAIKQGKPAEKPIVAFHKAFLNSVRRHGKLNEWELMAEYKLRSTRFLDDLWLIPEMWKRKKLFLRIRGVHKKSEIKKIFKKAKAWNN